MKRILALRPTPATVLSCIALFVALGGVSYGVATGSIDSREIADNSVRSKDIRNNNIVTRDLRNNDIRAIDIRNNTIRGRDIAVDTITDDQVDESKLQQVPSALTAAQLGGLAASEYARARAEAVSALDLAPGAIATGAPFLAPGVWRDPVGTAHLQGSIEAADGAVFTLPPTHRPGGTVRFRVADGADGATLEIDGSGAASLSGSGGTATVSLDGVSFRAP